MKAYVAVVSSGFGNIRNKVVIYRPEDSEHVEFAFRDLVWDALEVEFPDSFKFRECMDDEYRLFDGRGRLLYASCFPGYSSIEFFTYNSSDEPISRKVRIIDGKGVFGSDGGFAKGGHHHG